MREIRKSGSEGGEGEKSPFPIPIDPFMFLSTNFWMTSSEKMAKNPLLTPEFQVS